MTSERGRSRAGIPDIDGDGLNGAMSIHHGVIGVFSGRQNYCYIVCKRKLQPNTSHRPHSGLVEIGNRLGPRPCQRCERCFKDYGEDRSSSTDESFHHRIGPREQHKSWLAGYADVCENPVSATRRVSGMRF